MLETAQPKHKFFCEKVGNIISTTDSDINMANMACDSLRAFRQICQTLPSQKMKHKISQL